MKSVPCTGWFITGTDTGVGKTRVAVALTRALVARGLKIAVMKPVAAGSINTPGGPRNDDALELLGVSNVAAAYEDVNPWLFPTPASPHLAARAEGVTIAYEPIVASRGRLAAISDALVVEGAGGWLAPISGIATMADIADRLALPVILVVGMRLGCLNHALLTREAIRARGLPFRGWIANKLAVEMPLVAANIDTLSSRFGMAPLAIVPAGMGSEGTDLFVPDLKSGTNKSVPSEPIPSWATEAANTLLSA